ncbi:porin [Paucibacter sp. R3-3]|uniref:Porin n=1 Tax=Roseateles agri TaxID=3098619 RepID=A0ABU5DGG0_9BURK|nr:porin [Paucibacter sp. R3-3]MDY0744359.1 porin [Paucibacter sp. R3-3]
MKKSIVALAVLSSVAGMASAQSSVTLFGVIDLATRYTKSNGESKMNLSKDGLASSRLGVRGVEDLGGGLKAGFWLEGGLNADTGAAGANVGSTGAAKTTTSTFWNRRSTVSLSGDFGEVRLGRDKTATQLLMDDFDPYGDVGQGAMYNTYSVLGSENGQAFGDSTQNRNNNQIIYIAPGNLGGFYGQLNVAAGEGAGVAGAGGQKQVSGRVGYKLDALHVAGGLNQTTIDGAPEKLKLGTIAGSYDFGMVKPAVIYTQVKYGSLKQDNWTIAATAPVGPGLILASYTNSKFNDTARVAGLGDKADHYSVGYVYNLSKRTALYGNVSEIKNKGASAFALADAYNPVKNGSSGSVDVGIKHAF